MTGHKHKSVAEAKEAMLAELPSSGALPKSMLLSARSPKSMDERKSEELTSIRDALFRRATAVVDGAMRFAELDPEDGFAAHKDEDGKIHPPKEWIAEMGRKKAMVMMRTAMAAWMKTADAPAALKLATQVQIGIIRAKATEKGHERPLNVALITLPRADDKAPEFEELVIDVGES